MCDELVKGIRIDCWLDACGWMMHCYYEKIVIVDDEIVFVGGIDLIVFVGDCYDFFEYLLCEGIGWYDVFLKLCGLFVRDVVVYFVICWDVVVCC